METPRRTDAQVRLVLARPVHAGAIARLSRDRIEHGLGWSWNPQRVARSIAASHTNVVVALDAQERVAGFGIMKYRDEDAHLLLLAVDEAAARRRVGSALVAWLEASARVAGIGQVWLEARASNLVARHFYRRLGYRELHVVAGYYSGVEAAVRLGKDLTQPPPWPALPAPSSGPGA
jgi:[ribosomal protein S18]-alanine N-acetyltransferase